MDIVKLHLSLGARREGEQNKTTNNVEGRWGEELKLT